MAADTTQTSGVFDENADAILSSPPRQTDSVAQAQADDRAALRVAARAPDRRADAAARSRVADPGQQLSHRRGLQPGSRSRAAHPDVFARHALRRLGLHVHAGVAGAEPQTSAQLHASDGAVGW